MSQTILPPELPTQEIVTIESQPRHIPEKHRENLGPVSDTAPESWRYNPDKINAYYRYRPLRVIWRLLEIGLPLFWFFSGRGWIKLTEIAIATCQNEPYSLERC